MINNWYTEQINYPRTSMTFTLKSMDKIWNCHVYTFYSHNRAEPIDANIVESNCPTNRFLSNTYSILLWHYRQLTNLKVLKSEKTPFLTDWNLSSLQTVYRRIDPYIVSFHEWRKRVKRWAQGRKLKNIHHVYRYVVLTTVCHQKRKQSHNLFWSLKGTVPRDFPPL